MWVRVISRSSRELSWILWEQDELFLPVSNSLFSEAIISAVILIKQPANYVQESLLIKASKLRISFFSHTFSASKLSIHFMFPYPVTLKGEKKKHVIIRSSSQTQTRVSVRPIKYRFSDLVESCSRLIASNDQSVLDMQSLILIFKTSLIQHFVQLHSEWKNSAVSTFHEYFQPFSDEKRGVRLNSRTADTTISLSDNLFSRIILWKIFETKIKVSQIVFVENRIFLLNRLKKIETLYISRDNFRSFPITSTLPLFLDALCGLHSLSTRIFHFITLFTFQTN